MAILNIVRFFLSLGSFQNSLPIYFLMNYNKELNLEVDK